MEYKYRRDAFKNGKLIHSENVAINENVLFNCSGGIGFRSFESLIEKWNYQGNLTNVNGIAYEYTIL